MPSVWDHHRPNAPPLYPGCVSGITGDMRRLPLTLHTIYVDLLDKLLDDAVATQGRDMVRTLTRDGTKSDDDLFATE